MCSSDLFPSHDNYVGGGGSSASGAGQAAGVSNPGTQAVMMGIQAENMKANTQLQRAEAKKAEAEDNLEMSKEDNTNKKIPENGENQPGEGTEKVSA